MDGAYSAQQNPLKESTFVLIKPDGVQRGLVGDTIGRFEKKGFTLKVLKLYTLHRRFAEKLYADLSGEPFFDGLVDYIHSGPVLAMVWEGENAVATGREIMRITNAAVPAPAPAPGTTRVDYTVDIRRYVIYCSDTVETARKEIDLWFREGTTDWDRGRVYRR